MAFQLSPGVNFSEIDLTNATAAVGTTEGALAGVFRWGPINERTLITSENQLVDVFGKPDSSFRSANNTELWTNAETFYTAANFLGYSDTLYVTRVVETGNTDADKNAAIAQGGASSKIKAKYYGELGNSIEVSHCFGVNSGANTNFDGAAVGNLKLTIATNSLTAEIESGTAADITSFRKGDKITITTDSSEDIQDLIIAADVTASGGNDISTNPNQTIVFASQASSVPTGTNVFADGDEGVVPHVAGDPSRHITSILVLDSDVTITAGAVVQFSGDASGLPGGVTAGTNYFAAPVSDVGNSFGDVLVAGGKNTEQTNVKALKLFNTYADARAYDETVHTLLPIQLTASTGAGSSATANVNIKEAGTGTITFTSKYTGLTRTTTDVNGSGTFFKKSWGDSNLFDAAPSSATNLHLVVKDVDGKITGTAGTVIESYSDLSTDGASKSADGTSKFVTEALLAKSKWLAISEADATTAFNGTADSSSILTGGSDGLDEAGISLGNIVKGYDLYKDATDVDVSLILQGKPMGSNGYELGNYIIDNICESRRDCVAFISPPKAKNTAQLIAGFAGGVTASTYAVMDSGYKYQYDKYTDVYRWIPLNGDVAGLCARTDDLRDPWFSPAGYNRGNIKNVVKLNFNPNKSQRDLLYKNGVNPVITQAGQGTVLFGDKTFAGNTSAFDRINVRRLFIVLEKTIANASKSTLFEFNDEFTRATFRNLVEPFLRDVQGRRGIYDFKVICDETNNTGQVIDTNSFVGDIYIKPARSINFIQLNFVAVRTGVEFSEVVGAA